MVIVLKGEHLVKIQLKGFKMDWKVVADIYKVGFPSIVMQSIGSFMIIFYNMILVAYSTTAVAVLGIYFRIQSFVFMPVFGLNQGAMPIIGYNYGARNRGRMMETYKEALKVAFIVMAAGVLLFQLIPAPLLSIFDASERCAQDGCSGAEDNQHMFPPGCVRHSHRRLLFQGTGHGMLSLYGSLIRQLVGILPLAYILIRIGGVTLSWAAFPLAEILGLTYSALMFKRLYKRELSKI